MHWKEYEELTGTEVTQEAYENFIEPMYEAVGLDKGDFIKYLNVEALADPTFKPEHYDPWWKPQLDQKDNWCKQMTARIDELTATIEQKDNEIKKWIHELGKQTEKAEAYKNDYLDAFDMALKLFRIMKAETSCHE